MANIARNKKAFHDYEILERYEAGIELIGSEVKSLRLGKISLKESFVKIIRGEAFMFNAHISHISTVNEVFKPEERRSRKLLLHKKEILKLEQKVSKDSLTIVVLDMYFNKRNLAKLTIALARGKKLYDKRADLKKKDLDRRINTALKNIM
jgi:SsrA-binding protein